MKHYCSGPISQVRRIRMNELNIKNVAPPNTKGQYMVRHDGTVAFPRNESKYELGARVHKENKDSH
jgi:hypothetical protein